MLTAKAIQVLMLHFSKISSHLIPKAILPIVLVMDGDFFISARHPIVLHGSYDINTKFS